MSDLTILCVGFCAAAVIAVVLLCVAIWDFVGWKITRRSKTKVVGEKGNPFEL